MTAYGSPHARRVYDATHDLLRACMDAQNYAAHAVAAADGGDDRKAEAAWAQANVALGELRWAAAVMQERIASAHADVESHQ